MLLGRLKTEIVLEVVRHKFDIGFGAPFEDIIFSIWLFDTIKISFQEVFWSRRLLDSETLSSDGVKYTIRVLMYNNQVIEVSGHIIIVVSFIAHPDVASCHGRGKTKGCYHLKISFSVFGYLTQSKYHSRKYSGADVSLIVKPFPLMESNTQSGYLCTTIRSLKYQDT